MKQKAGRGKFKSGRPGPVYAVRAPASDSHSNRGGAAASRRQPPNSFGGGALQRSEKTSPKPIRFSAGRFLGTPSRAEEKSEPEQLIWNRRPDWIIALPTFVD